MSRLWSASTGLFGTARPFAARRDLLVQYPRIGRGSVGRHLNWPDPDRRRPSEERPGRSQVAADREHDVDDLTVLVDSPVQVRPPAGHLHVGLIDEPPVTRQPAAGASSFDELGGEPLNPPVDGHVINADAAFAEQLLDVPVREAVSQVPAHRDGNHLTREPEAGECGRGGSGHHTSLPDGTIS